MNEQEKLCAAVDGFASAMKKRLLAKEKKGFSGWDCGDITAYAIPTRLFWKAAQLYALINHSSGHSKIKDKILIDITNFAMFLWVKINRGKP